MHTLMASAAETVITAIKDRPDVYTELYARALVLADGEKCTLPFPISVFAVGDALCFLVEEQIRAEITDLFGKVRSS